VGIPTYAGVKPHAASLIGEHGYTYDPSGNQVTDDDVTNGQIRLLDWDEENRLQEISDNGHTTTFKYDDAGERVIKRGAHGETAYVNQFWTVRNRSVATNHVFVGSSRMASKLSPGEGTANADGDPFAQVVGKWYLHRSQQGWVNGKNTQHNPNNQLGTSLPNGLAEDQFIFFFHPDHLGSTSFVTDRDGELYEHVGYFPFGETWVEQASNTENIPYLFTGKELDQETGLYYFGARYYDPRTSVWQSSDPAALSRFTPKMLSAYSYAFQNPVRLTDPNGTDPQTRSVIEGALGAINPVAGALFGASGADPVTLPPSVSSAAALGLELTGGAFAPLAEAGGTELGRADAARNQGDWLGAVVHGWAGGNLLAADVIGLVAGGEEAGANLRGPSASLAEVEASTAPRARLPQDVAVNPVAPKALPWTRSIGRASHNQALLSDIASLPKGATDIRVNQQQVNARGDRVGVNRPDLQYTVDGKRHYIEYEGLDNPRGSEHEARILANDPDGSVTVKLVR
jgi:RHS repeat-associated protein